MRVSINTQAILLLTAPLLLGKNASPTKILSLQEYIQLTRQLKGLKCAPADLLGPERLTILEKCQARLDVERVNALLDRGLLLSQAVERWYTRGLWVLSRADAMYPRRLKERLKEACPPILYGCGNPQILLGGGLAVVGSRNVDESLLQYAEQVGALASQAGQFVVSGGARGIDQAAMLGALRNGGRVVGILGDSLEKTALQVHYREGLAQGRLALISPFDPGAGFQVGHAMQRNKYLYAMADAALVVSSDFKKGGTWAGALEQLEKYRFCSVFVRPGEEKGLAGLKERGAVLWPEPKSADELIASLSQRAVCYSDPLQMQFDFVACDKPVSARERLLATVSELLTQYSGELTPDSVGDFLGVSHDQARLWLESGDFRTVDVCRVEAP